MNAQQSKSSLLCHPSLPGLLRYWTTAHHDCSMYYQLDTPGSPTEGHQGTTGSAQNSQHFQIHRNSSLQQMKVPQDWDRLHRDSCSWGSWCFWIYLLQMSRYGPEHSHLLPAGHHHSNLLLYSHLTHTDRMLNLYQGGTLKLYHICSCRQCHVQCSWLTVVTRLAASCARLQKETSYCFSLSSCFDK